MNDDDIQKIIEQNELIIQQNADILERLDSGQKAKKQMVDEYKTNTSWNDLSMFFVIILLVALVGFFVYLMYRFFGGWDGIYRWLTR